MSVHSAKGQIPWLKDNHFRPHPPPALRTLLLELAQTAAAHLVVDLGSGTDLSTRFWADAGTEVVGIEPSTDMRNMAAQQTTDPTFVSGAATLMTPAYSMQWPIL